ncbi:hypothetical protein FQN54_003261 [Arachnomyces sp. PD_36]|nr:hypothetical protein FQN54_003261 [Arachnomyces sp. PD_36]
MTMPLDQPTAVNVASIPSNNSSNNNTTSTTPSNKSLPNTHSALTLSLTSFLSVTIHQILFLRSVYPRASFLPVRAYNYPVRQSRHPKVCTWISDAATAIHTELMKSTTAAASVVIFSVRTKQPLEKYTFDMSKMPRVPSSDAHTPLERSDNAAGNTTQSTTAGDVSNVDLEAQFRAVLARLASACARLTPLPPNEECSFTVCIDLRDGAEAPAGVLKENQAWIAAEPRRDDNDSGNDDGSPKEGSGSPSDNNNSNDQGSRSRAKTVPVRRVDAGEMKLEVWVEEAKGKFDELDRIESEHPP